jgi:hypothetical protein
MNTTLSLRVCLSIFHDHGDHRQHQGGRQETRTEEAEHPRRAGPYLAGTIIAKLTRRLNWLLD